MMYGISFGFMVLLLLCVPAELVVAAISVIRDDDSYLKAMVLIMLFGVGCGVVSLVTSVIADALRDITRE